jgi:hypothetical protein
LGTVLGSKGVHLGFFLRADLGTILGLKGSAFFFKAGLGQIWGWLGGFLKAELRSDNNHISKLAYKCMRLENMEPIAYKMVLIH